MIVQHIVDLPATSRTPRSYWQTVFAAIEVGRPDALEEALIQHVVMNRATCRVRHAFAHHPPQLNYRLKKQSGGWQCGGCGDSPW